MLAPQTQIHPGLRVSRTSEVQLKISRVYDFDMFYPGWVQCRDVPKSLPLVQVLVSRECHRCGTQSFPFWLCPFPRLAFEESYSLARCGPFPPSCLCLAVLGSSSLQKTGTVTSSASWRRVGHFSFAGKAATAEAGATSVSPGLCS